MKHIQSEHQLVFHRNPAYWDGHVLGESGPDTAQNTANHQLSEMASDAWGALVAARALRSHIADMHTYWPDNTLQPGEIFDPNEYEPFTVIALSKEVIRVRKGAEGHPLPPHPGNLPVSNPPRVTPNLQRHKTSLFSIYTPSFAYQVEGQWGIVTQSKHGNRITTALDSFVSRAPKARVAPLLSSHSTPDVIPVGQVLGALEYCAPGETKPATPSPNFFQRYNHIDILDFGAPPNRRKLLGNILSKLAIGELPKTVPGV